MPKLLRAMEERRMSRGSESQTWKLVNRSISCSNKRSVIYLVVPKLSGLTGVLGTSAANLLVELPTLLIAVARSACNTQHTYPGTSMAPVFLLPSPLQLQQLPLCCSLSGPAATLPACQPASLAGQDWLALPLAGIRWHRLYATSTVAQQHKSSRVMQTPHSLSPLDLWLQPFIR